MRLILLVCVSVLAACGPTSNQWVENGPPKDFPVADGKTALVAAVQQAVQDGLTVQNRDTEAGIVQTEWSRQFTSNSTAPGGAGETRYRLLVTVNANQGKVQVQCQMRDPSFFDVMTSRSTPLTEEDKSHFVPCTDGFNEGLPRGWVDIQRRVIRAMAPDSPLGKPLPTDEELEAAESGDE